MAVYDALIVAAWVAINVIYTQQRVALVLPIFKSELSPSRPSNLMIRPLHKDSSLLHMPCFIKLKQCLCWRS